MAISVESIQISWDRSVRWLGMAMSVGAKTVARLCSVILLTVWWEAILKKKTYNLETLVCILDMATYRLRCSITNFRQLKWAVGSWVIASRMARTCSPTDFSPKYNFRILNIVWNKKNKNYKTNNFIFKSIFCNNIRFWLFWLWVFTFKYNDVYVKLSDLKIAFPANKKTSWICVQPFHFTSTQFCIRFFWNFVGII